MLRGRFCNDIRFALVLTSLRVALQLPFEVQAQASASRRVHFYTFSDTLPHPGICALAEATSTFGRVLRVIGLSKRPGYILIHSHSPTLKFLMLQDVVEYEVSQGRIDKDDLMIFADGHDVMLQRSFDDIVKAYDRWPGSPYLISGEKNCWPWPHTHPSHGQWDPGMAVNPNTSWRIHDFFQVRPEDFCRVITPHGPYRYPNIGLSMGPVWRVLEVLRRNNRIVLDEDVNDQGAMWIVILRHAVELNIVIDQKAEVFMNFLQYQPGELEREPCADDWFVNGEPPQNLHTRTSPPLLHFNGPSHEDGVWPNCFHANNGRFRAVDAGHHFFDVDHNVHISTDAICDYSWYRIRNFHDHPLNANTFAFLEGFYQLPVDQKLLAFRGNTSAVDRTRLGREADLHANSPLLRETFGDK